MKSLEPHLFLFGGHLKPMLGLTHQRSVLHALWGIRSRSISDRFGGSTDQEDEDAALAALLGAVTADELGWVIRNVSPPGWSTLDDELESKPIDQIAERLSLLFDRRDYTPWRMIRHRFAATILSSSGGSAADYLIGRRDCLRDLVADLALRQRRAAAIGALDGLDEDNDVAALVEIQRASDRLTGHDATAVRGLHAFCSFIDRTFRNLAAPTPNAETFFHTITLIVDEPDPVVRDAGLDALGFLGQTTIPALEILFSAIHERAAAAVIGLMHTVLTAARDAVPSGNGAIAALEELRREIERLSGRLNEMSAAMIQGLESLEDIASSTDDSRAVDAIGELESGKHLGWLPTALKIRICKAMLESQTTEDDDEQAILSVLSSARTGGELFQLYQGMTHDALEYNIDGVENDQLYALMNAKLVELTRIHDGRCPRRNG